MSGGEKIVSHTKEEENVVEDKEGKEEDEVKQQAKVAVHLTGNKEPVVTLVN